MELGNESLTFLNYLSKWQHQTYGMECLCLLCERFMYYAIGFSRIGKIGMNNSPIWCKLNNANLILASSVV